MRAALRDRIARHSRVEVAAFAVLAALTALGLLLVVIRQFGYGMEYDEAYLLHVVKNLAEGRGYVDDGVSFWTSGAPFEPRISTGPTVLVPSAGVWWLTGGTIAAVRLVPLLYFGILLASTGWLFHRAGGAWTALAALAGFLALPVVYPDLQNTSLMPGRFVGELAATALLVAAAALLTARHPLLAGLAAGLAALTKLVFLLPAVVLLLVFVAWAWFRARPDSWRTPLWFLPALVAPLAAFEMVKLLVLGADGYRAHLEQTRAFLADQAIPAIQAELILTEKVQELTFQLTVGQAVVAILIFVVMIALSRRPGGLARARFLARPWAAILGLALASSASLAWWLLRSAQMSGRPAFPFVLLLTVIGFGLLGHLTARMLREAPKATAARVLAAAAWLAISLITLDHVVDLATDSSGRDLLAAQERAALVLEVDVGFVPASGYWTHPDLLLLSGLPSAPFDSVVPPVAVFTSTQSRATANLSDAASAADRCNQYLFKSRDVIVCNVPWG